MEDNVSQVKSKTYREDTLYQLKLEIDTSLDTVGRKTFTKDLLNLKNYKGRPLETYPFFAPYKIYRKGKIQRMTYLERVELFFNRQRFEQVVFGKKSKTKRKAMKRKKYESRDDGFEDLKEKNFILTLKMLFSTAFPIVDNVSRSIEYFGGDILSNFTLKGTNLEFLPFLSGKFDKKFSHLKLNNEIYTVTKVIWVNDIFNHPLYNRIIDNFRKIKDDMDALDKREEGVQNNKRYLVRRFLELPIEKEDEGEDKDKKKPEPPANHWKGIIDTLTNVLKGIKEGNMRSDIVNIKTVATALKKDLEGDLGTYQKSVDESNDDKEINTFFDIIESKYKENLKYLTTSGASFVRLSDPQRRFLSDILDTYNRIFINTRAINYIKNFEFRFSQEDKEYADKIKQRIEEIFPRAKEFSDQLTDFARGRTIGNSKWSKLVQSRELSSDVKTNFEKLSECYTNENCNIDESASEYLEVELDEITKRPENAKVEMYEAFLQVNIIEGEVTNKNYSKIKCKYLDEELDNFLDNMVNPQDDWNIQNEKNYFSVKELVEKVNKELEEKSAKKKSSKTKKAKPIPPSEKRQSRKQ